MKIIGKIRKILVRLRLQPIRVYCLHHVCEHFDAVSMHEGDWMALSDFQNKITTLCQNGVEFISLSDAWQRMCNEHFRCKKLAVITFDDGYSSIKEVLPWLHEQCIPCTLFINGKYTDGSSYRDTPEEKYLTQDELLSLIDSNGEGGLIEVFSHGWEHNSATQMSEETFRASIEKNMQFLLPFTGTKSVRQLPFFHAYTWGEHTTATDNILHEKGIVPVLMDGMKNYAGAEVVHRELLK